MPDFVSFYNVEGLGLGGYRVIEQEIKIKKPHCCVAILGDPGEIRTPDLLIRSQTLYPTELLSHRKHSIILP